MTIYMSNLLQFLHNLLSFIKTFDVVKTNLIATAVFKYGAFITKLVMYVFIFVNCKYLYVNCKYQYISKVIWALKFNFSNYKIY